MLVIGLRAKRGKAVFFPVDHEQRNLDPAVLPPIHALEGSLLDFRITDDLHVGHEGVVFVQAVHGIPTLEVVPAGVEVANDNMGRALQ